MKHKYYLTQEQASKIDKINLGATLKQRLDKILNSTKDERIGSLGNGLYVKKIPIKSRPTMIWYKEEKGDTQLYILRELFLQHNDYERTINEGSKSRWKTMYAYSPKEEEEIRQLLENIKDEEKEIQTIELPDFTPAEYLFIKDNDKINHKIFDETIYETKEWIKLVQSEEFNDYDKVAISLRDYIYDHCTDDIIGYITIPIQLKEECCILVNKQREEGAGLWILMDIVPKGQLFEEVKTKDINILKRDCRRAYPYTTLEDPDFFRDMEKDPNSNFILSTEERDIVASQNEYPLFISGRAGSGKSTVLQYLFAEIVLRYLYHRDGEELKRPIYLSYSNRLVNNAEKLLRSLLGKNNVYCEALKSKNLVYKDHIENDLGNYLSVFKELVSECIRKKNPEIMEQRFARSKYLSYSKFRQEWQKRFGNLPEAVKNYGPSLSWHVIRTYIKGWNSEFYLTPEEYAEIGRDNKDVRDDVFKIVYDKVWIDWYSEQDFWDDQDIVRYCLHPDDDSAESYANEMYSAVFCDEAQDFTRVEIDFILKISSFSNRKYLNPNDIRSLPFVFAGDEFQTLNPTGFSWDSLKSYFTKRLAEISGFPETDIAPNDPVPLTKNYRSTAQIVRLGNRIQFLRETRFGQQSMPQDPYFSEEGEPIYCLSQNNRAVWDKLKEEDVVLIVPSADGQTPKEYIEGTAIKEMITFYDNGAAEKLTILNPTQAKGLEYENVAIYGFDCLNPYQGLSVDNLIKWFETKSIQSEDKNDISLKYQVNNAYVAVTRAKTKLFIIDNFDENSFWAFAFSAQGALDKNVKRLNNSMREKLSPKRQKLWDDQNQKMGWIIEGDIDKITGENIQTFKENTMALEKQGHELSDPTLLRQAAARYRERGEMPKYYECQAYALTFDQVPDHLAAADAFIDANKPDKAIANYWIALEECQSSQDNLIIKKLAKLNDYSTKPEVKACVSALQKNIPIKTVNRYLLQLSDEDEIEYPNAWAKLLTIFFQKASVLNASDFKLMLKLREKIKSHIAIDAAPLINIAFTAKLYKDVIALCDEDGRKPQEYFKSKVEVLKYPESIIYFEGTGDPKWKKKILELYHANLKQKIDARFMVLIGQCALDQKETKDATVLFPTVLSHAQGKSMSLSILEKAMNCGIIFNQDVLKALIDVRYVTLDDWRRPTTRYNAQEATSLFGIVDEVKTLQSEKGRENLINQLKAKNVIIRDYFSNTYSKYARTPFVSILLYELGTQMEKRGTFIDATRFYDWAKNQTDDPYVKKQIEIRWIACKERQTDKEQTGTHIGDSINKRKEIGIPLDEKLPSLPEIEKFCNWDSLFETACHIGTDQRGKVEIKKSVKDELKKLADSEPKPERSKKLQKFAIHGYEFRFNPSKQELSVSLINDEEDLIIKIRRGVIPKDADFVIDETNRMTKSDGVKTPFSLTVNRNKIEVSVFEDEMQTGMKLLFEY